ncbi:hypothetical protein HG536_0A01910 [Torulaspora globosa]|uniref:EKC/KEOPS complex subunit GON7 n=1 Tax=Torulaspora globosa TaxID=48254 RepID=A0A7G3ZA38_9SACH|nr:uncharacterized protein HG536_0A01910 [Torulaspora globosa]QLL30374.1 hypothetical protein HG536_0A01910 [Torulaspora globosa]
MLLPTAKYCGSDAETVKFEVNPADARYQTTDGRTTGASPYVLNAGQVDRDRPSEPRRDANGKITALGELRTRLTGLQDDINEFLTQRMELAKGKKPKLQGNQAKQEERIENEIKELLDGGDGEDDADGL